MDCRSPVPLACTCEDVKTEVENIKLRDPNLNMDGVDQFLAAMRNLEAIQLRYSNLKLDGVDRFTAAMQSIEMAVQFPDAASFMSYIWGLVLFLLQNTENTEAFDDVLDVYEKLGYKIPLLERHKRVLDDYPESDVCLAYIYTDVQLFHRCAHTLISLRNEERRRPFRVTGNLWGCIFDRIAKSLDIHRRFIQDIDVNDLSSYEFEDICEMYSNRLRDCRENQSERKPVKEQVMAWISASKKTPLVHKLLQDMRECCGDDVELNKVCDEVTGRMKSECQPLGSAIWLCSKGGYSKTLLASRIIDELTKRTTKTYYFYCQKEDPERRTHFDILKGILQQMVDVNRDLVPFCTEQARLAGSTNLADAETLEDLMELFFRYGDVQFIIINGLDECEPGEARKISTYFWRLATMCNNEMKKWQVRVLFMSQPMPELVEVEVMPGDTITVELNDEDNVMAYIEKRITDLSAAFSLNPANESRSQMEDYIRYLTRDMPAYFASLAVTRLLQHATKKAFLEALEKKTRFNDLDRVPLPFLKLCAEDPGCTKHRIAPLLPNKPSGRKRKRR